jgi:hypothetical protein
MKKKSVWLHNPTGNPKKTLFTVSKTEISLGDNIIPATDVASCKRTYPKSFYMPINFSISLALAGWMVYEAASFIIRLQFAIILDLTPELDATATNAKMNSLLQTLHLRTSTTDEQQTQLAFWLYISVLIYGLLLSNLIFRPRITLTSKNGTVVQVPFILVRPRKFAKCLVAARKIGKINKKART